MKRAIQFMPLLLAVIMFGSTVSFAQPPRRVVVREGGDLRAAAASFHSASANLVDAVLEAGGGRDWGRDDRIRELKRLMAEANEFARATAAQPYPALRENWRSLRYAYSQASDSFDRLPRRGEVDHAIDRTRNAMDRLVRAYDRGGPVYAPGPGHGPGPDRPGYGDRAELADAIDKAADQVRDDAKEIARDGRAGGSEKNIRYVLERMDEFADRTSRLEDSLRRGDRGEIREDYRKLRIAYAQAVPGDRFGSSIEQRYRRIGSMVDRFGDMIGY